MGTSSLRGLSIIAIQCSCLALVVAEDCEAVAAEEMGPRFIQHQQSLHRAGGMENSLPLPVTWMHAPRTGTSFIYTLLGLPRVCDWGDRMSRLDVQGVKVRSIKEHCPGFLPQESCPNSQGIPECSEANIGSDWSNRRGKVVGFFRQPEVRLMSEIRMGLSVGADITDYVTFASARQGCVAKILTVGNKSPGHCSSDDGFPTWKNVLLAKHRVETGFSFIGMTDKWDLSICLFNTMWGGKCRASQFLSVSDHDTENATSDSTDVTELNGFVDEYDRPLWDVAVRRFEEDLSKFGVSEETCVPCYDD